MTDRSGKKTKKKQRGNRTHGKGNTKNKRGRGSRRGAVSAKGRRNKMHLIKTGKRRKKGFNSHQPKETGINLRDINTLIEEEQEELDITTHGYDKVLGGGELKKPLKIKASSFSENARKKIEETGGEAIEKGG